MTSALLSSSLRVRFHVEWENESPYRTLHIPFDSLCQSIDIPFDVLQLMAFEPLPISLRVKFRGDSKMNRFTRILNTI